MCEPKALTATPRTTEVLASIAERNRIGPGTNYPKPETERPSYPTKPDEPVRMPAYQ